MGDGGGLSVAARLWKAAGKEGSEEMLINSFSGGRCHSWTSVFTLQLDTSLNQIMFSLKYD